MNEGSKECLYITSIVYGKKLIMEKLSTFSSILWHDKLGHPRSSMMWRIIEHSHGHPLKN